MPKNTVDIIKQAKDFFTLASDAERENRKSALDDIEFSLLGKQWEQSDIDRRKSRGKPCLTINKLVAYVHQVVNNSRQNKPSISVKPVDDNADPETAEIYTGLIRNIESTSKADLAYDTAVLHAVAGGYGYIRVNVDYAHDDTFDKDIKIDRVANQFAVFGDPHSMAADSSDWNECMIVDRITKSEFKAKYKKDSAEGWEDSDGYTGFDADWLDEDGILIAEYWVREEVAKTIFLLNEGSVVDAEVYAEQSDYYEAIGAQKVDERQTRSWKVKQFIVTGSEVLEENEWAGKYIPIVPVYGDEIIVAGKRYFKSLIRDAKDPQRIFNYWRTKTTELVALAPNAPWVGKEGAFSVDSHKWATANIEDHAFLQYKGNDAPQRQAFAGVPAGALQEAMNASDDIKTVLNMHDPSMGAESNETSGRAIMARQRQGEIGNFHFVDNLSRAIRHVGQIVIDLIPHVYTGDRIVRILGEDGKEAENVRIGEEAQQIKGDNGELTRVYDLSVGKYDVVVSAGPSFATKREEAATQMTEFIRSYPAAAPLISDLLAKNLDWPGAEEMAKRFKAMLPPQVQEAENGDQPPPEIMQLQQQLEQTQAEAQQIIQQLQQQIQEVSQKAQATTADKTLEIEKLKIDAFNAETNRLKVVQTGMTPEQVRAVVAEAVQGVSAVPEPSIEQQAQPKPHSKVSRAVKLDDGSWQVYTEYLDHQPQEQAENNEEEQMING